MDVVRKTGIEPARVLPHWNLKARGFEETVEDSSNHVRQELSGNDSVGPVSGKVSPEAALVAAVLDGLAVALATGNAGSSAIRWWMLQVLVELDRG